MKLCMAFRLILRKVLGKFHFHYPFNENWHLAMIYLHYTKVRILNLNSFPFSTSAFAFLLTIVLDAMAFRFRATLLFELGTGHIFGFFIIIVFSFRKTFSLWFDHLHILFYRPVFPTTYLWFQIAAFRIFWSSLILTSISCWKIVFFK